MFHRTATLRRPQSTASPARDAGPPQKASDPFFDNVKYLAIVLVACGHAWAPLPAGSHAATALYLLVYAFHMPAFIVISGYMSRIHDAGRPGRMRRLVAGVLMPYLVFEVAYAMFRRAATGALDRPVSLLDPGYLLHGFLAKGSRYGNW